MKNKKRLLVAVAAMSAFGIAAGTVSTFAWFKATNAGKASVKYDDAQSLSVTKLDYSTEAVGLPIQISVSRDDSLGNIQLVKYFEDTPATTGGSKACDFVYGTGKGYYHGFYDQSGNVLTLVKNTTAAETAAGEAGITLPTGTLTDYAIIKVTVTAPANAAHTANDLENGNPEGSYAYYDATTHQTWSQQEIINALGGTNVKVKVENQGGTRARFFDVATKTKANVDGLPVDGSSDPVAGESTATSDPIELAAKTTLPSPWSTDIYFGMYVDGTGVDDANFTVGLKVSVGNPTAIAAL